MQLCRKLFMGCKAPSSSTMDDKSSMTNGYEQGIVEKSHFITAGILGEGGFGKVFTGMMLKNGSWYAIKEIKKMELVKHKMGMAMIFSELDAMKRVNHPAAINLHFAFHDRKRCFFVLDLKTGGDLRYYLRKRYVFEECDVAFYIAAISSALDHIHSKSIIHRDVKPENIILDERGYPYLTDFGVSHVQAQSHMETTLTCTLASGTKQYLAPEVFTKSHVHGPEMDFWSLGVVAYELLFGRRPFEKHCPIAFISYLEKGLTLKRRQVKEMKMRQLSTLFANSNEDMGPPSLASSRELLRSSLTRDQNYTSLSPSQSIDLSSSPAVTNGHKRLPQTASASSQAHGIVSMKGSSLIACHSSAPSPARTTNSTELGSSSQDSQRELHFCSSVGVTNASGYFSSDFSGYTTPKKPSHLDSGGFQGSSPSATKYAIGFDMRNPSSGSSSSQPPSPQPTSVGKSNGCLLPDLKPPARSQSPPKSLFHSNNNSPNSSLKRNSASRSGQRLPPSAANGIANNQSSNGVNGGSTETEDYGDILVGGDAFEIGGMGVAKQHVDQSVIYEGDETGGDDDNDNTDHTPSSEKFVRAIPGDHWLVEDGILHPSLYVDIPESNPWLGPISLDCQRILAGFFEVRPNHRLGARNMAALKRCKLFDKYKLNNWDDLLHTRRFEPRFQPGKRFIKECLDKMDDIGEARVLGDDNSTNEESCNNLADLVPQELTAEEEEAFEHFYHVASQHEHLFTTSASSTLGANSANSMSSSFASLPTSTTATTTSRKMSRPGLTAPYST